jgi:hypothetical protein
VVDKHELRDKLAMLVTDNAANMVLARRLVIGSDGFKHILEMRWVLAAVVANRGAHRQCKLIAENVLDINDDVDMIFLSAGCLCSFAD